jgi:hypothetical protein
MYNMLKSELEVCMKNGPSKNSIEECFNIAGYYWAELRATIIEYQFKTEEEEILFFKTVKPLFTSELEYYSLLYYAFLFCPLDVEGQRVFWEREIKRFTDFKEEYSGFLDYYASGKTDLDKLYYLRAQESDELIIGMQTWDKEPDARTSHDQLIAKFWALERYYAFADKKLKEVSKLI